jgi:predicted ATPase/DNA-binding SARP family transcriptional activator/tetratricopeptide (TPR) repeat protein
VVSSLTVSVLGPLRVDLDGQPVALGRRARALLAALAVRRGQVVASDLLVELLWPDGAPADARNALQALVSRTRRALGPAGAALLTAGEGYVLDLPPEAVDAERFERAVIEARRSASGRDGPSDAGAVLGEVLGAWRGDPYLDAEDDPAAVAAASRLTELRQEAIDLRAEAVLRAGGSSELVADLQAWGAEVPLRERTHRALAQALYRAGRQADALDVLGRLRDRLRDELGLDPAPETDALYAAVLRRDAALDAPATEAAEGAARSSRRDRVRHLPVARTSFVGRRQEIAALRAGLEQARMVTLVGPGGTGKTRLAIEALRDLVPAPTDGVVLVELAPVSDPEDVLQHVAGALGLDPESGGAPVGAGPTAAARPGTRIRPLTDRVADHVADADLVLLLDNCEHVVDAAAEVVDLLLDAGPALRVVATSREALRVSGELLQAVAPLPVPPAPRPGTSLDDDAVAALAEHDAVTLFVARARAVDPTFRLDVTTAPPVVEIARRSDGLPLALELAAARVATLPVTELAARLEDRFRLLTGGRRTVRRQQTLEAVVAWSYDLLDDRQRWLLRRLGVCAGPVAVDLVEALVAAEDRPTVGPDEVLPVLVALAERSLLTLEPITVVGEDGEPASVTTVRVLETIRAFAQERLTQEDDAAAVRTAHAEVLAARARAAGVAIRGRDQLRWLDQLDRDLEELRAALTWWLRAEPSRAVEMGADLAWYWWLHDHHDEGIRWLEEALERAGDVTEPATAAVAAGLLGLLQLTDNRIEAAARTSVWARATLARAPDPPPFESVAVPLLCAYVDALSGSDPRHALAEIQATVEQADALGEDWVAAAGWFVLLGVLTSLGDHEGGWAAADRALQAAARSGDRWADFQTRSLLAVDLAKVGRYPDAAHHLARALPLAEAIGARIHVRGIRVQQACVRMLSGDVEGAEQQLRALLADGSAADGEMAEALVHHALGMTSRRRGDIAGAITAYRRAAAAFDASQEAIGAAEALAGLTHAEVAGGDLEAAAAALRSALDHAAGHPDELSLASTVPLLHEAAADLACARGDHVTALRHLGRAATLRDAVAGQLVAGERFDVDRIEAAARAAVSGSIAATALAEGAETTGLLAPID